MRYQNLLAKRTEKMRASDIREAMKLAGEQGVISFAGGFPTVEAFPTDLIQQLTLSLFSEASCSALQYGPTEGFLELRQQIAEKMRSEGVDCTWENVLITNGSQQGLDLISKVFVDPGDAVLVELPGYVGGLSAIANYEANLVGIPLDEDGVRIDLLEAKLRELLMRGQRVKFIYLVPNFQNPTGVTMCLERRRELVRLAEEYGFLILEDNPYGELRFTGEPLPHIKTFDRDGHVIYLGTFSKVFCPGLRIGWIVADTEIIRKFAIAKQGTDLCSNSLGQRLMIEVLRSGQLPQHVASLRSLYLKRRDAMLEALAEYMPYGVTWTEPQGGFFIWLTLPPYLDAKEMLPLALQEKIAYVSGGSFHADGQGKNTIRLAFSQAKLEDIAEGIRRLSRVVRISMEKAVGV